MSSTTLHHTNKGACAKCAQIMDKYPGFNQFLREWFMKFQKDHPEFHVSCAGRGKEEQDSKKLSGNSLASYGQSAHNYNCALDLFIQLPMVDMYDRTRFNEALNNIPYALNWYGLPGSIFKELAHVEFREWRRLLAEGNAKLVE